MVIACPEGGEERATAPPSGSRTTTVGPTRPRTSVGSPTGAGGSMPARARGA